MGPEFASGFLGALLGGGISVFFTLLSRRDDRSKAIDDAMDTMSGSADALRELLVGPGEPADPAAVMTEIARYNSSASGLMRRLKSKDRVVSEWLMVNAQVAINPGYTDETRMAALLQVPPRMSDWRTGRLKTSWFAADCAETRESIAEAARRAESRDAAPVA